MASKLSRAGVGAAVVTAFACGLLFASGLDLTRFGFAQDRGAGKVASSDVKSLAETGSAFEAIADHVTPSVVAIATERKASTTQRGRMQRVPPGMEELFRQFEQQQQQQQEPIEASGTGFIVSKDGYILTNNHVVADADKVTVTMLDRRAFTAKVVGRDSTTDVAVIKIDAKDLPVATLGDDATARVGQWVVAIGNPLGFDFTVTAGIISAKGRSLGQLLGRNNPYAIMDYIQTDAAINPGNSGGPLVNIRGEVVGINSAIASPTGTYAGYGFAIPVTLAKQVMNDLISYGKVRRAVLGVSIRDASAKEAKAAGLDNVTGVSVQAYSYDDKHYSPAEEAGLSEGDVIVSVDGHPTDRTSALQRIVRGKKPGDVVALDVMRYGSKKTFRVKLMEVPDKAPVLASADNVSRPDANSMEERKFDKVGIAVEPISSEARARIAEPYRKGLMVSSVSASGPSYRELGADQSILVEVLNPGPRHALRTASDLDDVLKKVHTGDLVSFLVYDVGGQGTRVVTIPVQ